MNEPGKIRNVALVGHRGTGKTSLLEALLFRAGVINRLGKIEDGSTVGDWDDDEKRRQLSLASSLAHVERDGLTYNLIDTPGDPSFQADTIGALDDDEPAGELRRVRARDADSVGFELVHGRAPPAPTWGRCGRIASRSSRCWISAGCVASITARWNSWTSFSYSSRIRDWNIR